MTFEEYRDVIRNGERIDWHGIMVPEVLITGRVRSIANMIMESLTKYEMEISELRKGTKEREKKQNYYDKLFQNVRNLPYNSNGLINDVYMVKYKRIMAEIEEENKEKTKPKTRRTRKPKASPTTKPKVDTSTKKVEEKKEEPTETPVVKGRRGRNKLIFGNK